MHGADGDAVDDATDEAAEDAAVEAVDDAAAEAGDDATEGAPGRPCPLCERPMRRRHCKYVCPRHGVVYDCSDTFY